MAALQHDIAKKQHRERAQPLERRKWGLLEKKKDYKLRAQDFHRKEAQIKLLKKKAEHRNVDEFNYGMIRSKTDKNGILITERQGSRPLSVDAVKLLKTQDSGYVRTITGAGRRRIDKLQAEANISASGKHIVFVDTVKEAQEFSPEEYFDTDAALLNRRDNRPRRHELENEELVKENAFQFKQRLAKLKKLDAELEKQQSLTNVQYEMDLQRELMKKGDKKKIIGKDGTVSYKWKNVRKK